MPFSPRVLAALLVLLTTTTATAAPPLSADAPSPPVHEPHIGATAYVTGGAGLVLIAIGSVFALSASSLQSELDEGLARLPRPARESDLGELRRLDDLADSGRGRATVAQLSLIGGAIALFGGVALAVLDLTEPPPGGDAPDPAVSLAIGAAGGGQVVLRW